MLAATALVYHPDYLHHETGSHPENKKRLEAIMGLLAERGYLERLQVVSPQPATVEQVCLVHRKDYVERMAAFARRGGGMWDMDTVVGPASYEVALLAAGGAITAVDLVLEDRCRVAWALVRPPGHHAEPGQAMGFCLFNNIAVAASHARQIWGLERILIVDWDVHHGNGTQAAFWNDPAVLYCSFHQMPLFPGTGRIEESGGSGAMGYTINVPLPPGTGDAGYVYAVEKVLLPMAEKFKPQLVLVSAGQDGHFADPLASQRLTTAGYRLLAAAVGRIAAAWSRGRVVLALEGGYNLRTMPYAVAGIIAELAGIDDPDLADPEPPPGDNLSPAVRAQVDRAWEHHRQFWE